MHDRHFGHCGMSYQLRRRSSFSRSLSERLTLGFLPRTVSLRCLVCLHAWQDRRERNNSPQKLLPMLWRHRSPDDSCQPQRPSGPAACLGHWTFGDTQSELLLESVGKARRTCRLWSEALLPAAFGAAWWISRHRAAKAQWLYLTCTQHFTKSSVCASPLLVDFSLRETEKC
jgi:hypothetical protein